MTQDNGHRRGGKYDTVLYYKRPNKGWHPGWIVTGSRSSLESFMIRGFTPLWEFGTIPAPQEGESWNEWQHILKHPKGASQFPAEQVMELRWYIPENNPLPGLKWPQLQGHKVVHYPCPECEREFVMIDGAGGPVHLARHLNMIHKWDRTSLTTYGDRVGINFNESFSSLKKAYEFGIEEDGLANVGCDECDYVPAAGKSAEKAVRMHKLSAHKPLEVETVA
jgi:hypothetical protein